MSRKSHRKDEKAVLVAIDLWGKKQKGSKAPPIAIVPPANKNNEEKDDDDSAQDDAQGSKQAEEVPLVPQDQQEPPRINDDDSTMRDTMVPVPTVHVPVRRTDKRKKGWRKKLVPDVEEPQEDSKPPSPPPPPQEADKPTPPSSPKKARPATPPPVPAAASAVSSPDKADANAGIGGGDESDESSLSQTVTKPRVIKKRRPRVEYKSVSKHGILTKKRMVPAGYLHLPVATYKPGSKCQLHSYLMGKQTSHHLTVCETCNVALCSRCYKPFHTVLELNDYRGKIEELYKDCA